MFLEGSYDQTSHNDFFFTLPWKLHFLIYAGNELYREEKKIQMKLKINNETYKEKEQMNLANLIYNACKS